MNQRLNIEHLKQTFLVDQNHTIIITLTFALAHYFINSLKYKHMHTFSYHWFLINGIWIHLYLDVLVGLFGFIQPYLINNNILSQFELSLLPARFQVQNKILLYNHYLIHIRYQLREPTVIFITVLEFLLMGPLCIIVAILHKNPK